MPYYPRLLEDEITRSLSLNPVTAILGPRQCGKSTLAKHLISTRKDTLFLDLERPSDLQMLDDPEWFLQSQSNKLICVDEIHHVPELFPLIRSLVDENRRPGMFLILGSASRDLIKQSSESLAGRISYKYLTPFLIDEKATDVTMETYLARGGFPPALFSQTDRDAFEWKQDFISTFLERDLLQFSGFTPKTMRRLWQMLAHTNGETINYSKLAGSLGVSHNTIRNYTDLLEGTFMVYQLQPWYGNTKKRLVKSPKVYITDCGITGALLQLDSFDKIFGHPVFGSLWESVVLVHLKAHFPNLEYSFYRTNHGNEIDFVLRSGAKNIAVECKASQAPSLTAPAWRALDDVNPDKTYIVAPVKKGYSVKESVQVVTLLELTSEVSRFLHTS